MTPDASVPAPAPATPSGGRRLIAAALGLLGLLAAIYVGVVAMLSWRQRDVIYLPSGPALAPAEAGFDGAERIRIRTIDGETLTAWFKQPAQGRGLILYFPGNAGALADRASRFTMLTGRGEGLLAISYRGFPGSTGAPSEEGLLKDAEAAMSEAISRGYEADRIVLVGESLGAAVATGLAARRRVAAVVLEAPFLSMRDMGARLYPWAPVGLVLRDTWRSDQRIARIRAPLLQIHGLNDEVIPMDAGEKLFALARQPKIWRVAALSGHTALEEAMPQALDFIEAHASRR